MARIAGVDLPNNKHGEIGLTYIFGIGRSSAKKILSECGIDPSIKCGDWNDEPSVPRLVPSTRSRASSAHPSSSISSV